MRGFTSERDLARGRHLPYLPQVFCKSVFACGKASQGRHKGFIRVSHSPAGAPVLFARKPGRGFAILRGLHGLKCRNSKGPIPFTID